METGRVGGRAAGPLVAPGRGSARPAPRAGRQAPEGSRSPGTGGLRPPGGTARLFRCCFSSVAVHLIWEQALCEAERPGFIPSWRETGPRRRGQMLRTLGPWGFSLLTFDKTEASGCGVDGKGFRTKPEALRSSVGWVHVAAGASVPPDSGCQRTLPLPGQEGHILGSVDHVRLSPKLLFFFEAL